MPQLRPYGHLAHIVYAISDHKPTLARPDLVIAVRNWGEGIRNHTLQLNAKTPEAAQRIKTILYGMTGDIDEYVRQIMDLENRGKIDPNSELELRGRLDREMRICMISGVQDARGKPIPDVPRWVENELFRKNPDLEREMKESIEIHQPTPANPEGSSGQIIDLEPGEYRIS